MKAGYPPSTFLALLALMGLGFCLVPIFISKLWAKFVYPPKGGPSKFAPYECGVESIGEAWVQLHSAYYRYAIVFLVLDVETVFFLPIATQLGGKNTGAILAGIVFILLLVEGLLWAWKKGMLRWN